MIARRQAEMLAYADNCLEPARRAAFEAQMRAEPDIGLQIDEWRRQNNAIRDAFAGVGERPAPIRLGVHNENARADWMPQPFKTLRHLNQTRRSSRIAGREGLFQTPAAPSSARRRSGRAARALAGLLLAAATMLVSATSSGVGAAPEQVISAGLAAYRTYALGVASPVEYATRDAQALRRWLASQIARATPVPDFSALELTLMGGRIIPGARGPAALLIYEDRYRRRLGLVAESHDAPAPIGLMTRGLNGVQLAYWTGAGHSFALFSRDDERSLVDLASLAIGD